MRRFNSHSTSAFTMVELMGAVTIAMVLIFLMYSIFDKVQTVFVAGQNRARAMEEGRTAMDLIVDDVRALSGGIDGDLENISWLGEQLDPQVNWNNPTAAAGYLIHNPMGSISASTNDFVATDGSGRNGYKCPPEPNYLFITIIAGFLCTMIPGNWFIIDLDPSRYV